MLKQISAIILAASLFSASGFTQQKTEVNDANAAKMLRGRHLLSLQWISWDHFGSANITQRGGVYYLKGEQKGRGNDDFLRIDGVITSIDKTAFVFEGTVETQISHIFGAKPCKREGTLNFRITGKRKYWRMQQMDNPCDEAADYVDIYFRNALKN